MNVLTLMFGLSFGIMLAASLSMVIAAINTSDTKEKLARYNFIFAALFGIGYQFYALKSHSATSTEQAIELLRWKLHFGSLALLFLFNYVVLCIKPKHYRFSLLSVAIYTLIVLVLNQFLEGSIRYTAESITSVSLPSGDQTFYAVTGDESIYSIGRNIVVFGIFIWFIYLSFTLWRKTERLFSIALALYCLLQLLAVLYDMIVYKQGSSATTPVSGFVFAIFATILAIDQVMLSIRVSNELALKNKLLIAEKEERQKAEKDRVYFENAMSYIARGVSSKTGKEFFDDLIVNLQQLVGTRYAFIGLVDNPHSPTFVNTISLSVGGTLGDNFTYELGGTPCQTVLTDKLCTFSHSVQSLFPDDQLLRDMSIEGYIGSSILDKDNQPIGLVVALDVKALTRAEQLSEIMGIFSARAGAEMMRMRSEENVRKLAYEDYLTGLPNRASSQSYLQDLINNLKASSQKSVLFFIDLDHFKNINDALGHDVGDDVIRYLAQRLATKFKDTCYLSRYGGDEFLLVYTAKESQLARSTEDLAKDIQSTLDKTIQVGDHILDIGVSIGVLELSTGLDSVYEVLRCVEIALYKAKELGRSRYVLFDPEDKAYVVHQHEMANALRAGLQKQQLIAFYQPQINSDGKVIGAELLIRWMHPEKGTIEPNKFIQIAEETGLIHKIGDLVINQALDFIQKNREFIDRNHLHFSVNVSPWQFARPDFVDHVRGLVKSKGAEPKFITLELTETSLLTDLQETALKLSSLRKLGFRIALDDFGTGYSSLAYLRDLELDVLKIDKAFIDEIAKDIKHPLVYSMVSIGNNMGLEVVAEGVETEHQRDQLVKMNCSIFQGYFYSKPLSESEFRDYLKLT